MPSVVYSLCGFVFMLYIHMHRYGKGICLSEPCGLLLACGSPKSILTGNLMNTGQDICSSDMRDFALFFYLMNNLKI